MVLKISGFDSISRLVSIRFYKGQESHFQDWLSPSCHIFLWLPILNQVYLSSLMLFWCHNPFSPCSLLLFIKIYLLTFKELWICQVYGFPPFPSIRLVIPLGNNGESVSRTFPKLSTVLVDPQKSFTYHNLQNFIRKSAGLDRRW